MKKAASKSACGLSANYTALSPRMELFITNAPTTSNLMYPESMFFPEGNGTTVVQNTRWD
jgi:hypothetical protein